MRTLRNVKTGKTIKQQAHRIAGCIRYLPINKYWVIIKGEDL